MPRRRQPTLRERRLAAELRFLRETRHATLTHVARAVGWKTAKLGRVETAASGVSVDDLGTLLDYYEVDPVRREELLARAAASRSRRWSAYEQYVPADYVECLELAVQASAWRTYDSAVIHGYLQTESYARAIIAGHSMGLLSPGEVERRVELRMVRQSSLTRDPDPLQIWSIIGESVLDVEVGSRAIMHEQIAHLLKLSELPNVDIQILPSSKATHPGLSGSFAIVEFPEPWEGDAAYVETLTRNMYLSDADEVHRYNLAYRHLSAMAYDLGESRAILARRTEQSP